MRLSLFQVDAFSSRVFAGNPAAVCPLDQWLPAETMQSIAAENNLAETAFFVRNNGHFELRWFTPACEVDLCGHATLASAYVLFNLLKEPAERLDFETKSGILTVSRENDLLVMDFPSRPPAPVEAHPNLLAALGGEPIEILAARDYLVRYGTEAEVRALKPNFETLAQVDRFAVIVTAPGSGAAGPANGAASGDRVDFVSRFFAPAKGINEDPVTGSAHCTLIPYWAAQLGKTELRARQISQRTGDLICTLEGDRVKIAGRAALYLKGEIEVDT